MGWLLYGMITGKLLDLLVLMTSVSVLISVHLLLLDQQETRESGRDLFNILKMNLNREGVKF